MIQSVYNVGLSDSDSALRRIGPNLMNPDTR